MDGKKIGEANGQPTEAANPPELPVVVEVTILPEQVMVVDAPANRIALRGVASNGTAVTMLLGRNAAANIARKMGAKASGLEVVGGA